MSFSAACGIDVSVLQAVAYDDNVSFVGLGHHGTRQLFHHASGCCQSSDGCCW
jgi:hypothetical protein